jgi:hypothetical protein
MKRLTMALMSLALLLTASASAFGDCCNGSKCCKGQVCCKSHKK